MHFLMLGAGPAGLAGQTPKLGPIYNEFITEYGQLGSNICAFIESCAATYAISELPAMDRFGRGHP